MTTSYFFLYTEATEPVFDTSSLILSELGATEEITFIDLFF